MSTAVHAFDLDSGHGAPSPLPAGMVPRTALVRRLIALRETPVVSVVAPAGYGKSALLAEWALRDDRPFSFFAGGRDQVGAIVRALDRTARAPSVTVVDDAHALPAGGVAAMLRAGARLTRGGTLVLASRAPVPAPAGRLRAEHVLADLSARELAMTRLEAALLLDAAGLRLGAAQVDRLLELTEGWPAGLYLAALSIAQQSDEDAAVAGFSGGDRLLADYFRGELLAGIPRQLRRFVRRCAILERLTGELCDAVANTRGSTAAIERLRRAGLPIEPLDRCDTAYRLHPLLGAMLRTELVRMEPGLMPQLHARAADWHAQHGDPMAAARHAVASGDAARAGRQLWAIAPSLAAAGRPQQVHQWVRRFPARDIAAHAPLALTDAMCRLTLGRRLDAWRALPADGEYAADAAAMRAFIARNGVPQMAADASRASRLAMSGGACDAIGVLLRGVAHQLADERAQAEDALTDAASRPHELVAAVARAQLALLAADDSNWDDADRYAHAPASCPLPEALRALLLTAAAVAGAERGEIAQARADARDAVALLSSSIVLTPWLSAETHAWLARAELKLSDGPTARRLLARAASAQGHVVAAPALARWVHDGWALADAFAATATGDGPALTIAELRVLRLLESCMSYREIGERLHVSPNTVKSQALAVYRKFDVSRRSDAVECGRIAGLIGR